MAAENETAALPRTLAKLLTPRDNPADDQREMTGEAALNFGVEFEAEAMKLAEAGTGALTVGLIDCYRFSRECLMAVLESRHPHFVILPFISVEDCITNKSNDVDIIIYYPHVNDTLEAAIIRNVGAIRRTIPDVPIIVLSDAEDAHQPKTIRSTLSSGAHGFIPTRTTGILIAIAAIRFVKAGGTFAPLDQLLTTRSDREPALPEAVRQSPLTSRQMAVLSHLQQGKANKIIAHELSMSESTVKVHVRNIMRKMGATNRTQAAYKAQQFWNRTELNRTLD